MEITRDVMLDLMPLYVAGEVSEDSRKLIEAYLEGDEELRKLYECAKKTGLKEVPMSSSPDLSVEAYEKVNRLMVIRTLVLAVIISGSFLALIALAGVLAGFFLAP